MALTDQQRLEALEEAYFSGVREVQYGDKVTTYRTMDELLRAINALKDRMGTERDSARMRRRYVEFDKGL